MGLRRRAIREPHRHRQILLVVEPLLARRLARREGLVPGFPDTQRRDRDTRQTGDRADAITAQAHR